MTLDGYLAMKASIAAAFCGSLSKLKALMYALYSVGSRMTFRCCEVEWILARLSSRTKSGSVCLMERSFRVPWPKDLAISKGTIHGHKDLLKTVAPVPEALQAMRAEAKRNKTAKLTSRQIDREITTYRRQRNRRNKK